MRLLDMIIDFHKSFLFRINDMSAKNASRVSMGKHNEIITLEILKISTNFF